MAHFTKKPWSERQKERGIPPGSPRTHEERRRQFRRRLLITRRDRSRILRKARKEELEQIICGVHGQLDQAAQRGDIKQADLKELKLEVERYYTLRGGRKWQFRVGQTLLDRFDSWKRGDEEGWKKLMEAVAETYDAWLDSNPHPPEEFAAHRHLFTWEFGKALAFRRYGISHKVFNAIYLRWLLEVKPEGFGTVVKEKGEAEPWLLADEALQSVHQALSNKEAWELARDMRTFDGYVWRSYANAIRSALKAPPKSLIRFVENPEEVREKELSKGFFDRQQIRFPGEMTEDTDKRRIREIADDRHFTESAEDLLADPKRNIDVIKDGIKHLPPGRTRDVLVLCGWINDPWPKAKRQIANILGIHEKTVQRDFDKIVLILKKTFNK